MVDLCLHPTRRLQLSARCPLCHSYRSTVVSATRPGVLSAADHASGLIESYRLAKKAVAVKGCRKVGKKDMKWNAELPKITVDPETYRVEADGVHMAIEPATKLPLTQGYFLF